MRQKISLMKSESEPIWRFAYGYNGLVWFGGPFFYGPDQWGIPTWVGCQAGLIYGDYRSTHTSPLTQDLSLLLCEKIQNIKKKKSKESFFFHFHLDNLDNDRDIEK